MLYILQYEYSQNCKLTQENNLFVIFIFLKDSHFKFYHPLGNLSF